ncbi:hypothetical protein J416_07672 [Gracilibacillus halophilus YIM-C55.5]|uniref:Sporulation protein YtxC n=1 Tax=Gracilibacillus halophilus YIM-C55.5 TaxID=1308866 RepID=N4WLP0_9BACI|nr:sporulation protein YtxC [Gracilibacillus halophilus]ENH97057.1 hypothetical protein J416_07672 [Gracilibacillus halophilus YIM-C55.5]
MLEVHFEYKREAKTFFELAHHESDMMKPQWKRSMTHTVFVERLETVAEDDFIRSIAKLFSQLYITHRETTTIRSILQKKYYFTNEAEIEKISTIARSLLEKDEYFYEDRIHQHELRDILVEIFLLHVEPPVIRFDSIIYFRLHHYLEQLTDMVGLAIDEFKREEEYQSFVHTLREFVLRKHPNEEVVHVVQGDIFQIYNDDGVLYHREKLNELLDQFPLFIFGLQENEWNIAPLIALAPNHIYMYGDDPSEPHTHTVMNIFQENLSFYPFAYFPFFQQNQKQS